MGHAARVAAPVCPMHPLLCLLFTAMPCVAQKGQMAACGCTRGSGGRGHPWLCWPPWCSYKQWTSILQVFFQCVFKCIFKCIYFMVTQFCDECDGKEFSFPPLEVEDPTIERVRLDHISSSFFGLRRQSLHLPK